MIKVLENTELVWQSFVADQLLFLTDLDGRSPRTLEKYLDITVTLVLEEWSIIDGRKNKNLEEKDFLRLQKLIHAIEEFLHSDDYPGASIDYYHLSCLPRWKNIMKESKCLFNFLNEKYKIRMS